MPFAVLSSHCALRSMFAHCSLPHFLECPQASDFRFIFIPECSYKLKLPKIMKNRFQVRTTPSRFHCVRRATVAFLHAAGGKNTAMFRRYAFYEAIRFRYWSSCKEKVSSFEYLNLRVFFLSRIVVRILSATQVVEFGARKISSILSISKAEALHK